MRLLWRMHIHHESRWIADQSDKLLPTRLRDVYLRSPCTFLCLPPSLASPHHSDNHHSYQQCQYYYRSPHIYFNFLILNSKILNLSLYPIHYSLFLLSTASPSLRFTRNRPNLFLNRCIALPRTILGRQHHLRVYLIPSLSFLSSKVIR